jgi:hypothetical protein
MTEDDKKSLLDRDDKGFIFDEGPRLSTLGEVCPSMDFFNRLTGKVSWTLVGPTDLGDLKADVYFPIHILNNENHQFNDAEIRKLASYTMEGRVLVRENKND